MIGSGEDWIKVLMATVGGLLMWNGKRLVKRVDDVEKNTVGAGTFNETLKALRTDIKDVSKDIKEFSKEFRGEIKEVHQRINKI